MPSPTDDTSWDDVYAELGIEVPKSKPAPVPEPRVEPVAEREIEPTPVEPDTASGWGEDLPAVALEAISEDMIVSASESDDDSEDGGEGAEGTEGADGAEGGEGEADGQTGPERKRRRRRRRRRKGGPGEEAAAATEEAQPGAFENDEAEEPEALVPVGAVADEGHSETLRDLIANWNVPSWDDIISGLYRPER